MPIMLREQREAWIDSIIENDELKYHRHEITLQDMDDWLSRQPDYEPCFCPTCQTKMGRYKYTFDKSFLFSLIAILKQSRENKSDIGFEVCYYEQIHHRVRTMIGKEMKNTRFRVMCYEQWGLITKVKLDDYVFINVDGRTERRKLGFFKLTDRGFKFLCNRLEIPKIVYVFNDNVYRVSNEKIKLTSVPDITNAEWEAMKKPF